MATVELRVHGIAGGSAETILGRPVARQVAGDDDAGFFRPDPPDVGPDGMTLEAYQWGRLTAGAAARALWLLLLPFMLANLAVWLLPPGRRGAAACRLFALTVTGTFVLGVGGVALDLLGWQGTWAPTGRRLAASALVTAAFVGLLWYLGRWTWAKYESYPPSGFLADPGFWNGRGLVGRLRSLHIAAAFAVLAALLLRAFVPHARSPLSYALAVGVGVVLLGCGVAVCLSPMAARDTPPRWAEPLASGLRWASLLLAALTVLAVGARGGDWPSPGGLPGFEATVDGYFAAQLVLLAVLAVRAGRVGYFAPLVASVGLLVGVAFAAGLSQQVERLRGGHLALPVSYRWTAVGFVFALLCGGIGALAGYLRIRRLGVAARPVTDADFPGARAADPGPAARIDASIGGARLTDHLGPLLRLTYLPVLAGATGATGLTLAGIPAPHWLAFAVTLGTWLIAAFVVALLVLGWQAYTSQTIRRIVGVVWDIGTFWPRAAHPLAPPCYGERAVPELAARLGTLAPDGVVLAGASQGSVLAVAAILQVPVELRGRVALLSSGSPLNRLYARTFRTWIDASVLAEVAAIAPWLNLWRDTDPIGGPVGRAGTDRRLVDPVAYGGGIRGHGSYTGDPAYAPAVLFLRDQLMARP